MRTTEVTDHLTQLTRLHFVNAYLVREDDGLTLVDTTMGGAAGALIAAAEAARAPIGGSRSHTGTLTTQARSISSGSGSATPSSCSCRARRAHSRGDKPDGKLAGSWARSRPFPTRALSRAIAWAASRWWRAPATPRGMSRSSTIATAR